MHVVQQFGWVFYFEDELKLIDKQKCGKWMYFFGDAEFADQICKAAIEEGAVESCKRTDDTQGVCCFYINGDDLEAHKRTIQFFLDHNLIRKTKAGKLYNISFKYDYQTGAGEYGEEFNAEIKLDRFLDLYTGEWKV